MFDFSWSEILVIGVVALVVIGPKELPGVLRTLGQWMGKVRRMASEFQNQFQDAIREAELADLKKEVDNMATHFDPLDPLSVRKDLESAQREVETALAGTPAADAQRAPASSPAAAGAEGGAAPPSPEVSPTQPAAAKESVPVAPTDEPKAKAEHASESEHG